MNDDFDVGPGHELDHWLDSQHLAVHDGLHQVLDIEAGLHDALTPSLHRRVAADLDQVLDIDAGLNAIVAPRPADTVGVVTERLERLAARVAELGTAERELRELSEWVSSPVPVAPEHAASLQLALATLHGAAYRQKIQPVLESCERATERALTEAHNVRRELHAQLDRRNELRGRLQVLNSLAEAMGRVEDIELAALYRQAHQALWRAPCNVPAAERLIANYAQAVQRKFGTSDDRVGDTVLACSASSCPGLIDETGYCDLCGRAQRR